MSEHYGIDVIELGWRAEVWGRSLVWQHELVPSRVVLRPDRKTTDTFYWAPDGIRYRSRAEVLRTLNPQNKDGASSSKASGSKRPRGNSVSEVSG